MLLIRLTFYGKFGRAMKSVKAIRIKKKKITIDLVFTLFLLSVIHSSCVSNAEQFLNRNTQKVYQVAYVVIREHEYSVSVS